jgi:hypothetical protein
MGGDELSKILERLEELVRSISGDLHDIKQQQQGLELPCCIWSNKARAQVMAPWLTATGHFWRPRWELWLAQVRITPLPSMVATAARLTSLGVEE